MDLIATPILAGVAFGFGAWATTEDIQRGDTGAAVEDGIGTALNVVPGVGMLGAVGKIDNAARLFKAADEIKITATADAAIEAPSAMDRTATDLARREVVTGSHEEGRAVADIASAGVEPTVLESVPSRRFVTTIRGTSYEIPGNWEGRVADNNKGIVYQRPGATGNADMIRIMEPTPRYPKGYVRVHNSQGQPVDVFGKPGPPTTTHIPEDYIGPWPAWPAK